MDQVDEVIDALSARLSELEAEVASLSAEGASPPVVDVSSPEAGDSPEVSSDPQNQ